MSSGWISRYAFASLRGGPDAANRWRGPIGGTTFQREALTWSKGEVRLAGVTCQVQRESAGRA